MTQAGKTVLVTGASSGIGLATAVGLAKQGAQVLLVGRTPARCAEALAAVRAAGDGRAHVLEADFSSLAGISALADQARSRVDRLDILVNNAGTLARRRTLTTDGYETMFAVNHLGYFLLTGLLLPVLRVAERARIVTVASEAHRSAPLDLDDLQSERDYGTMRVYSRSKTANILWTQELARRLDGSGITANSLHPGVIRTRLARDMGVGLGLAMGLAGSLHATARKRGRDVDPSGHLPRRRRGVGALLRQLSPAVARRTRERPSDCTTALGHQRGAGWACLPVTSRLGMPTRDEPVGHAYP